MSTAEANPQQTFLRIQGMTCAACQVHVQRALAAVPGVESASVNLMANTAEVVAPSAVSPESLIEAVRQSGYTASLPAAASGPASGSMDAKADMGGAGHLGLRAVLSLAAGAVAMVLSMPLMMASAGEPSASSDPLLMGFSRVLGPITPAWLMSLPPQPVRWTLCGLALAVMIFAAPEIYRAAWNAARHRSTNMNTLIALGTLAAFASSLAATLAPDFFTRQGLASDVYYEAVALVLAFLLSGRWLEARARARATSALEAFARLQPTSVRLLTVPPEAAGSFYASAPETLLPLDAIERGDFVRILPGDRVPVDGAIVHGRSSLDESMLTGEPLPVTRSVGESVSGGTLNLDGPLVVRATAVGAASTLAQMQRLLAQAQSSRAPLQQLADRVSAIFVPSVLGLAVLTFAAWWIATNTLGHHAGFALALANTIAVVVIACPCAMGLAVPAAITVSLGRAAQAGLLIKGGEALERLSTIDTLALDKTGTLTEGRPRIASFALARDTPFDSATLIAYAAAAERLSTHPLARAVVEFNSQRSANTPIIENLQVLPGIGVTATVFDYKATSTQPPSVGHALALGNAAVLPGALPPELIPSAELDYATPLYLVLDGQPQAAFFAVDQIRPSARSAIAELRTLGIRPMLLTGDLTASALPIAREAGITDPQDVRSSLLPGDKLTIIRELQASGHKVAMAGDGINDAAALAQSDAGLAMAAGADLAREAGDVLLLHPDLHLLPAAVRIARRTTRIMRQNLAWAMIYNVIGLPIAAGVLYPGFHILLSPVLASAAMALSSVSVLANSLRLRRLG